MPHKRNPTACLLTIASARRTPGLLANFLGGMLQEQERAAGGWQAEWPAVEGILKATAVALESMAEVAEGLSVDVERMRRNIDATHGAVFAERAVILLSATMGAATKHAPWLKNPCASRASHQIFRACAIRINTSAQQKNSASAC